MLDIFRNAIASRDCTCGLLRTRTKAAVSNAPPTLPVALPTAVPNTAPDRFIQSQLQFLSEREQRITCKLKRINRKLTFWNKHEKIRFRFEEQQNILRKEGEFIAQKEAFEKQHKTLDQFV